MITTIGTDIVHTTRFAAWIDYLPNKLAAVFSPYECTHFKERKQTLAHAAIPSERKKKLLANYLASRFAAKESFYKALSQLLAAQSRTKKSFSFKTCAPFVWVEPDGQWQLPKLHINVAGFANATGVALPNLKTQVSLAHDGDYAFATVFLSAPND